MTSFIAKSLVHRAKCPQVSHKILCPQGQGWDCSNRQDCPKKDISFLA